MPRAKSHTKETLTDTAMELFWTRGYAATSFDDLVQHTGVSRHGIYNDFGGKHALFLACLDRYRVTVVSPAIKQVEAPAAGLSAIEAYFEAQIGRAEAQGLPGPGCLFANTMTELAPRDGDVRFHVNAHNDRLRAGFLNALRNAMPGEPNKSLETLAGLTAIFAQGLWSASRVTEDAGTLRASVRHYLTLISERIKND